MPFHIFIFMLIGILIFLLLTGILVERFLQKKNWSNPFINTFYIFNMIFSSPFNIIVGIYIMILIGAETELYRIYYSSTTITISVIVAVLVALTAYFLWTRNGVTIKISYKSLVEFSKIFMFRIPLLLITLGFFPALCYQDKITIAYSFKIMEHGVYVVPLFMLVRKYFKNKTKKQKG